jgi:uncharacterized membrane protein YfcA
MEYETSYWLFILILPLVSFLYSSVGHGGASGYLALMALFSFPHLMMKQTALLLNLFVAGISFYQYYKRGHFNFKLFFYFAVGSVPASFIGGLWTIDPDLYKKILGFLLLFAIARIVFTQKNNLQKTNVPLPIIAVGIGVIIGFFSGLIGIGGGIILTPILLLMHWSRMKEAAAVSALFIWVNSASGLIGQFSSGVHLKSSVFLMLAFALSGGSLGAYYGSKKWKNKQLEYFLALILTTASIKLIVF